MNAGTAASRDTHNMLFGKQKPIHTPLVPYFHMMAKPIGPICNLDCTYCYYLSKKDLFKKDESWRMPDHVLDEFVHQYIEAQHAPLVKFSWQGGEPTLLGLQFFEKVVKLQRAYCPKGKQVANDLQTNGVLLDDRWCEFLAENGFLVGLSIDGPRALHDQYRLDKNGRSVFDRVAAAARLMQKHGVEFNTLTVVNRANGKQPLEVYRFLRDELGSRYMQFIPCVEPKGFAATAPQRWDADRLPRLGDAAARPGNRDSVVTDWSVEPDDFGAFLCTIFDEWHKRDVGSAFVILFELGVSAWMGMSSTACTFAETCGNALAFEHDGTVYACDHYVYPEYRLGNINTRSLFDMVHDKRQREFGLDKKRSLPEYCLDCEYLFACNGECPKNRFILTPDGEYGLNYLCSGLKWYFRHVEGWMKQAASALKRERSPSLRWGR